MTGRLDKKICVITGSGGAIGGASAVRFAQEGARIVGCDINATSAEQTLCEVRASGGDMVSLHPCDLTDQASCEALIDLAVTTYGGVDVLFNNAGKVIFNWIENLGHNEWQQTIDHELGTVFLLSQAAWPELIKSKGTILNTASAAGRIPFKVLGGLAHCASKGGVIAMTRQLAMEGRAHGIRANSISPGLIETPSTRSMLQNPEWSSFMLEKIMRGTPGRPDEIANVALFLVSEESSFINAADIAADGGMTSW